MKDQATFCSQLQQDWFWISTYLVPVPFDWKKEAILFFLPSWYSGWHKTEEKVSSNPLPLFVNFVSTESRKLQIDPPWSHPDCWLSPPRPKPKRVSCFQQPTLSHIQLPLLHPLLSSSLVSTSTLCSPTCRSWLASCREWASRLSVVKFQNVQPLSWPRQLDSSHTWSSRSFCKDQNFCPTTWVIVQYVGETEAKH